MKKLSLLIFLIIPFFLFSQKVDSLKTVLINSQGENRVNTLNELGNEYINISLDTSQMYFLEALALTKSLDSKAQLAKINRSYGRLCYYMGQYDSSVYYTQASVKLYYEIKDSVNICMSLNNLGIMYSVVGKLDSSSVCHNRALQINLILKDSVEISETYNNIGSIFLYQSQFDSARFYYEKAITYVHEDDYSTLGSIFNNIALSYDYQGDYKKSIEIYLESLKLYDKIDDERTTSLIYNNIGSIYQNFGFYDKAIEYYLKKADYAQKIGDNIEYTMSMQNIAGCYAYQGYPDSALSVYKALLPLFETYEDDKTKAFINKGIADCLIDLNEDKEALIYLDRALKLSIPLNDTRGINRVYLSMAKVYNNLEEYDKALFYFNKCDEYLKETEDMDLLLSAKRRLSYAQFKTGQYKLAYNTLSGFVSLNDSIMSSSVQQQISDLETKYQTEKKEQQIALQDIELAKNQETIAREIAESDKKAAQRNLLMIGFGLILVLAIVIYRGYKQKTQANLIIGDKNEKLNVLIKEVTLQKDEIEHQKTKVEKIHQEVSQSISYAERIQRSILPEMGILKKSFSDSFVFFKPRNVVSGDFYWFTRIERQFFATVADCTGHGVPGAFMSMLGVSFLREIVNKSHLSEPGKILGQLRKQIIRTLRQKGIAGEQKDGMDMAFIKLDLDSLELDYAGANNPLYIISNKPPGILNSHTKVLGFDGDHAEGLALFEIKADRMPIAIYEIMDDFVNHRVQLHEGDQIYMFSDGYVDQFGGPNDKKFLSKPFKKLLLQHAMEPMKEQNKILNQTFEKWIENSNQLDDISIMGIKI